MERKIFIILLCFSFSMLYAQEEVKKRPVYCNVMGYNFWGVGKVKVQLDLGRKSGNGFDSLYGEDGKKLKFNTMMAVLNYMGERGWRTVDNYFISTSSGSKTIHYLLEKWVTSDEEITKGLTLKEEEPYKPGKNEDDMY